MARPHEAGLSSAAVVDDAEAFERLYASHFDFVWRNLRRLGVGTADLEDAVQETFVTAYRRRDSLRPDASVRGWLFAIARRIAWRMRRGAGRRARLAHAIASHTSYPEETTARVERAEAWQLLESFVAALAPAKREVFVLSELEGMTGAEVAAILQISPNTVGSRLRAVREELARYAGRLAARERSRPPRLTSAALRQTALESPSASPSQRRAVRAAVLGRIAAPPATAVGTVTGLKLFVGTLAAGALGWTVFAAAVEAPSPDSTHAPAVPTTERVLAPTLPAAVVPSPQPPASEPREPQPAPARPPRANPSAATPSVDVLAAEARLLSRVQRHVSRGEFTSALELLDGHEGRFSGSLDIEALALRARASCGAGRPQAARRAAQEVRRRAPHHPQASLLCEALPTKIDEVTATRR